MYTCHVQYMYWYMVHLHEQNARVGTDTYSQQVQLVQRGTGSVAVLTVVQFRQVLATSFKLSIQHHVSLAVNLSTPNTVAYHNARTTKKHVVHYNPRDPQNTYF